MAGSSGHGPLGNSPILVVASTKSGCASGEDRRAGSILSPKQGSIVLLSRDLLFAWLEGLRSFALFPYRTLFCRVGRAFFGCARAGGMLLQLLTGRCRESYRDVVAGFTPTPMDGSVRPPVSGEQGLRSSWLVIDGGRRRGTK